MASEANAGPVVAERLLVLKGTPLDANGRTKPLPLDLPSDVESILVEITCKDARCAVDRLEGPNGQKLVVASAAGESDPFVGPDRSPNRSTNVSVGSSALLAPNNPSVTLTGGAWTVGAVAVKAPNVPAESVDITVWVKRRPSPGSGTLDLDVYLTGLHGWTPTSAPNDPFVAEVLAEIRRCLATASIRLGKITWSDTDPHFVETSSRTEFAPERLFERSKRDVLNVFLVRDLVLGAVRPGGLSGGIPGPLTSGTTSSGVIVVLPASANSASESATEKGTAAAHEIGHYLGLSHTIELDRRVRVEDQLPDTRTDMEDLNVMFPTTLRGVQSFSPEQGEVMRRHPLVH